MEIYGDNMKNYWLDKEEQSQNILIMGDGVIKDRGDLGIDFCKRNFSAEEGYSDGEMLFFINEKGEQKLVSWLLNKHKNDQKWLSAVGLAGSSDNLDKYYHSFPPDDEYTKQSGCCGDFPCNCTANLDSSYTSQYIHKEVLQTFFGKMFLEHIPIIPCTISGNIYLENKKIQNFTQCITGFVFSHLSESNIFATDATLDLEDGLIEFSWNTIPDMDKIKIVVSYCMVVKK